MKLEDLHQGDGPRIDNERGAGITPLSIDVDYFGMRVLMRPSTFLKLAARLSRRDADSAEGLKEYMLNGGKIASPYLNIRVPDGWIREPYNFTSDAGVEGHEGRNRMFALKELDGDDPIEVHLFFKHPNVEIRARKITPEIVAAACRGLHSEGAVPGVFKAIVQGPLFEKFA